MTTKHANKRLAPVFWNRQNYSNNGLATPSPDSQTKSCQTEPDEKVAGSVWLPGPEVWRKLEGSWPDCTRQRQNFTLITKRDRIWCCLAQSGQLPSILLQIFGPGNQIEPANFCLAPSGMILSGCLGLGVARALSIDNIGAQLLCTLCRPFCLVSSNVGTFRHSLEEGWTMCS